MGAPTRTDDFIRGNAVSIFNHEMSQFEGTKAGLKYEAGYASGELPECALAHPDRIPEQLPFFNKPAHREGEFTGDMS